MSFGTQINYKQLLDRHEWIRVPMIQRDYAQGRPAEIEVRESFLATIKDALEKSVDDPSLPLNLDFIYGSVEGDEQTRFQPLDGQQRLTTLFLLHWYIAWKDDQSDLFERLFVAEAHSRFAYSVRPSSNEFFDQLVIYRPVSKPDDLPSVSKMIADQPWYYRSWRLDPTIQAVLHMLDAIHEKFQDSEGLFARLLDEDRPAITFQLLDLKNFGLSDDLYIKMNARGKPLTPFETFKARYGQELANQLPGEVFLIEEQVFSVAEYVARRMDVSWANLFWKHRREGSDLYDDAFMNVFRAVALVSRNPETSEYVQDVNRLRARINPPSYSEFHSQSWLDEEFTRTLVALLDSWCNSDGITFPLLPDDQYFNEKNFFEKIVNNGASLSYTELIQFSAYVQFLRKHQGRVNSVAFQEWMRVIRNLSVHTDYNRTDDYRRSARGLAGLLAHSDTILKHFALAEETVIGFSELQLAEETLKARLLLSNEGWRELLTRAESHAYFRGQIGFLLDFSGVFEKSFNQGSWSASEHAAYQAAFERHFQIAKIMFTPNGLVDTDDYRWQRALLCMGDYLLPSGRNRSFLVNSVAEEASWKRLLSGSASKALAPRNVLKALFSQLSPEADMAAQLAEIIEGVDVADAWREAIVNCPSVFDYCERMSIRVDEGGHIYLLKRSQMNGAHAELFTFCLNEKIRSGELKLSCFSSRYETVNDTYSEPRIWLHCNRPKLNIKLSVEAVAFAELYLIKVSMAAADTSLADLLLDVGLEEKNSFYQIVAERAGLPVFLHKLDEAINAHSRDIDDV